MERSCAEEEGEEEGGDEDEEEDWRHVFVRCSARSISPEVEELVDQGGT